MGRVTACIVAGLLLLVLMWHAVWYQGPIIEQELGGRVANALAQQQLTNLSVQMEGQQARLSGTVASQAQAQLAVQVAQRQVGVTRVIDALQVLIPLVRDTPNAAAESAALAPVTSLQIVLGNSSGGANVANSADIVVRGVVPDAATGDRLQRLIQQQFPHQLVEVRWQFGARSDTQMDDLLAAVATALPSLGLLDQGSLQLTDNQLQLVGDVADFPTKIRLDEQLASWAHQAFPLILQVSAPVATESACQQLFDEMLRLETIQFETNSADINPVSEPLLQRLVATLASCGFAVLIGGHTDATGDDVYNQWLSERRAEAVAAYVVDALNQQTDLANPGAVQVQARGYGESQPLQSNNSRAGRNANRRIEFKIRRQQP